MWFWDGSVPAFMQPFPLLLSQSGSFNKTTKPLGHALEEILEEFASNSSLPSRAFLVLLGAVRHGKESDLIHYSDNFVLWEVTFCCKGVNKVFFFCFVWFDVWRRFGASATSMLLLKIYTLLAAIASHTFF